MLPLHRAGGCQVPSPPGPQEPGPTPGGHRGGRDYALMGTKSYFFAKEGLGRQQERGMLRHPSQHRCRIQHLWGAAAMQAALEGVPALAELLFCLGMGESGRPRVTAPAASREGRFKGSEEMRAESHPSPHSVPGSDLLCPAPAMRCCCCPPQRFPAVSTCAADHGGWGAASR